MVLCWVIILTHKEHLIILDKQTYGFLAAAVRFVIGVNKRLYTYIYNRTLTMFLFIINPANNRNNCMHKRAVVHAVFAVEVCGQWVVLAKHIESIYEVVLITKESINALFLLNAFFVGKSF